MKRRRQVLQVSTFPFLAVLLCAMGSLILLLLVIDRRAKAVSRAKAEQAAAGAVSEEAKLAAAQKAAWEAEWEQRRRQLHELLAREEEKVAGQIKSVQDKSAAARAEMQGEETRLRDLRVRLEAEMGQVARTQEELTLRRAGISKAGEKVEASRQELVRLAGELQRLEQTLRDLRTLREREKQTYSLIPYIGRHGDNRRPIYVECTAAGLVFHPDRLVLEGPRLVPMRIRAEVERRIAQVRESVQAAALQEKSAKSAYLLMLVRPDGIASYYQTQAALVGLKIDFGYEFVEADWILDFSGEDKALTPQPWMTARDSKATPDRAPQAGPPRPVAGIGRYRGIGGGGQRGDQDLGQATSGTPQGGGERGIGLTASEHAAQASTALAGAASSAPPSGGSSIPYPPGGGPVAGGGEGASDRPVLLRPTAQAGPTGMAALRFGNGTSEQGEINLPAGSGKVRGAPGGQGVPDGGAWSASKGPTNSAPGRASLGSAQPGAPLTPGSPDGGSQGSRNASAPPADSNTSSVATGAAGTDSKAGGAIAAARDDAAPAAGSGGSPNGNAGPSGIGSRLLPDVDGSLRGSPSTGAGPGGQSGGAASGSASANQGGSGGSHSSGEPGGEPGEPVSPYLNGHTAAGTGRRPPPLPLSRLLGNRDWPILVECQADAVVVRAIPLRVTAASLERTDTEASHLVQAVQKMIADRQHTLRPGEPPYRPLIRFVVHPDGLRTYYLAYPRLEALGLPLTRENVQPPPRAPAVMER
jgi:hypothetical protein